MTDVDGASETVRARAGLHDIRIHGIQHRFASRGPSGIWFADDKANVMLMLEQSLVAAPVSMSSSVRSGTGLARAAPPCRPGHTPAPDRDPPVHPDPT